MSTAATDPGSSVISGSQARIAARKASHGSRTRGSLLGLLAWVIGILFVIPILFMILTSLHTEADASTNPPSIAAALTTSGYKTFFQDASWAPLINSATASIVSTLVVLALAIPAAYALSIKPVQKWTDVMFFFLSTKMLPVVAGILPLYLIAQKLQLLDNIWFLIILYTSMNLPIAVWMMRSFLAEVPVSLIEAAELDGAGLLLVLRRVVIPIATPGIAATALICFIFSWNELLLARTVTNTTAVTAPVYLTSFVTSEGLFLAQVCAAAVVVSLPVLIAGFAAQNKLVQGLSLGAVK